MRLTLGEIRVTRVLLLREDTRLRGRGNNLKFDCGIAFLRMDDFECKRLR
jgi:hypothetical protein